MLFIFWTPEIYNGKGKAYEEVVTFHVGLFTEEIDEHVTSRWKIVNFCRDIPDFTFSVYLIKIDRKEFG